MAARQLKGAARENAEKRVCCKGHPLTADNIYLIIRRSSPKRKGAERVCKTCHRVRVMKAYKKK